MEIIQGESDGWAGAACQQGERKRPWTEQVPADQVLGGAQIAGEGALRHQLLPH